MADMRDWAIALDAAAQKHRITAEIGVDDFVSRSKLPRNDAWGTPYKIRISDGTYTITSAGANRVFQENINGGPTRNADDDIVASGGTFIQYPEGI